MSRSRVLEKLRAGELVSSFKVNYYDPRIFELVAMAGFDCIWVDQEHAAPDWPALTGGIFASKCHDTDVMVRTPKGCYTHYIRPLELDAAGIMIPHVMSCDDAKDIVKTIRFHPGGRRALDGGGVDGGYATSTLKDYTQQANNQRFLVFQIEDPEALDQLDEIAAISGFDMLFFGPGDFSQGIGATGEWNHPELTRARETVARVAQAHGKYAGTVGTPESLTELVAMGYQFINVGSDISCLKKFCFEYVHKFKVLSTTSTS